MGKNFSCNNVGGKRREADKYPTPYSLTRLFLGTHEFDPNVNILEPACGDGAITKVLKEEGFRSVDAFDIDQGTDFLTYKKKHPQMITNPPYSIAYEFIQHAKEIITEKFALLLPLAYLHGKRRYDHIWTDHFYPLKSVYVFTRYPHLGAELREDGRTVTGMMVYVWLVWLKNGQHPWHEEPVLRWLDNDAFIVRGKE